MKTLINKIYRSVSTNDYKIETGTTGTDFTTLDLCKQMIGNSKKDGGFKIFEIKKHIDLVNQLDQLENKEGIEIEFDDEDFLILKKATETMNFGFISDAFYLFHEQILDAEK